jgi:drug/metabolite transporter (DMT)-like permease
MNVGFVYAIAAAVTWGMTYTIDQRVLSNVSPLSLLFINSVITAIVLLPILVIDHAAIRTVLGTGNRTLFLIVTSIVLGCFANYFILSGIKLVGASSASIIEIAYPFFVVLFSILLYRTVPSMSFLIGGFLIFIGSAIITYAH